MAEFTMPSLGADMDEGTLIEWLVHPGDHVKRGDIVAVVETAKSTIEIECFDTGTIDRLLVEPATTVPVGTPLAIINGQAGTPSRVTRRETTRREVTPAPAPPAPGHVEVSPILRHLAHDLHVDLATVTGSGPGGRLTHADIEEAAHDAQGTRPHASPLARHLAEELHVELGRLRGTGKNGVIRAEDVRAAATAAAPSTAVPEEAAPPPQPPRAPRAAQPDRAAAMRRSIADLMSRSKHEVPHYYLAAEIDLDAALTWMRERNRHLEVSDRLVPAALMLKAAGRALTEVPELNGFWRGDRFVPGSGVHLGVAISLRGGGLIAPALHDADRLPLSELMRNLKDLTTRARAGRLRATETADPTMTVTNLGEQGVQTVYGVIYPPQVALLGLGKITERPVAVDGLLGVHPIVTATLSADHRASDGAVGARFLTALDRLLQRPEEL
ncbi:MAG TPA: dihydrolipoamide acetyltransferase family protein [Actinospica sp.]|nr:dihydrolipoamide acetyltransferase family protein [Actinospica sp.]